MNPLNQTGTSELLDRVKHECDSVRQTIHLTANENVLSQTASLFLQCSLAFRQHEGNPWLREPCDVLNASGFIYKGYPQMLELEAAAYEAANVLFSAQLCDMRPLSGVHAMICALGCVVMPRTTVYSFPPSHGGHAATTSIVERFGGRSVFLPTGEDGRIDFDALCQEREVNAPLVFYLDHGVPLVPIRVAKLRRLFPQSWILYDAAHTLGLIAGGCFQNPLAEGADILLGNTHKTFPGAQKGIVCFREQNVGQQKLEIISQFISNQQAHHAVANYVTMLEMKAYASSYAMQIIRNSRALSDALQAEGFSILSLPDASEGTHITLMQFPDGEHIQFATDLIRSGISVNARIAYDRPTVRIGVQEVTRRGFVEAEMRHIAQLMSLVRTEGQSKEAELQSRTLMAEHPTIHFSFDQS